MPVFRQASRALMYKLGAEKETFWFIELPGSAAVKTTVPYEDYEKVPETYQQHALTSVLNSHLPADALYEALAQAENLELFGLYGRAKSPHPLLSEAQKRNLFERNPNLCKLLGV